MADPLTDAEAADLRGENARLRQAYMTYKEAALRLDVWRVQSDKQLEEATRVAKDLRSCFEQIVVAYRRGAHPDNLRQLYQAVDQNLQLLSSNIQQAKSHGDSVVADAICTDSSPTLVKPPKIP